MATLTFDAAPGDTLFGLSPWYTYADYRRFVAGLPEHPHLERRLVGRSDGGRETLTAPDALDWVLELRRP
ncbi:MAG: hypothetical protein IT580_00605 [Verrucomicrobiales bacterium]|nr:hypothetical protein [Verrucomicrobiales bacterium]